MNVIRACATLVVLFAAACGGSNPEPEYRWEEEETTQIDEDHRPPPPTPSRDVYDDEDDEDLRKYEGGPSRSGATTGTYGGPRSHRGAEGAIFTVKRGVFCDESVRSCYTTPPQTIALSGKSMPRYWQVIVLMRPAWPSQFETTSPSDAYLKRPCTMIEPSCLACGKL